MAYTTYAEVQADFKSMTFTSTSLVTSADVTQFIVESDALIDSYLSNRYETPVASGDGLNLLKFYSRCIVSERVRKLLEVKQATNSSANQDVKGVLLSLKDILKELEKIQKGDVNLDGATLLTSAGGFYSRNVANSETPKFLKNTKQW